MNYKKIIPYGIAIVIFVLAALIYFSPVLEGKKILQSDIVQFTGMSKEIQDYRAEHHTEPYWTDAAFGGMPAFQVSTYFPYDFIKKIDDVIRFLPHPANYLFLYFIGFFVLLSVLKIDWRLAIFGSLAFGLSTYLIVILGVGHNAKAHAIGYFPLVLSGVLLVFQRRYFWGFVITTLASALEITAGHVQMTYYLLFVLMALGISEFIKAIQNKQIPVFFKSIGVLLVAAILAVGMNANHLLPTREYAKESTRSKSELTLQPDGSPRENTGGLDKSYITEYSYGITETFNLFIPRFMGGGNAEDLGRDSETYRFLKDQIGIKQAKDFAAHAPTYWGTQPIVAAPAYIGAIFIFLFVLSLFILPKQTKYWLLGSIILALLLSWGKNLNFLTEFFIDYVPMYDKFRAVSSIQVVLELSIPILGMLALHQFLFNADATGPKKEKALLYSTYITGGIALFFLVFGRSWFSFESTMDAEYDQMIPGMADALIQDRKSIFTSDSLRTLVLVVLVAATLWLWLKNKLKIVPVILIVGFLMVYDLASVAKRYVNKEDFVRATQVEEPFEASEADLAILKDKSHYRVANFNVNPLNDGSTSYFHKSIGGYHAAKPRRYQELFDYQIAQNNFEVLNMLHTKYIIGTGQQGETQVQVNDQSYGNAWFVNEIAWVKTADEEIKALDSLHKNKAVINEIYKKIIPENVGKIDSTASIQLEKYQPNQLIYKSKSNIPQITLFSEMYYPHGWKASIDGKEVEIFRANYVLRALVIPAGNHEIVFKFDPEIIRKGGTFSLISFIFFIVLIGIGIGYEFYKKKTTLKN
jgi:hypothetical protein